MIVLVTGATAGFGADPLLPDDVAQAVLSTAALPPRVNINAIEMMPVCQSFAALPVQRKI